MMKKFKTYAQRWWPEVLIAFVAFGVYANTLKADFLRWDDRQNIILNPWIEHNVLSMIWQHSYYNMYIPVTYTFWTALWHMAPNEPMQFHLANLLFHAANSVLVYMLARLLFRKDERRGAILAALIFACHPLQVETVAWISTGRDLLAAFFSLLASYLLLTTDKKSVLFLSWVLFTISCLSKPSVAIVPAAVALIAYGWNLLSKRRLITLGFWLIPGAAVTLITKNIQQLDADLRLKPMDLLDRLVVGIDSFAFYAQKFFVPYPLAADYGRTREFALDDDTWMIALGILAAIGVLVAIFRKRIEPRYLYFGALFVLLLTPILGVIPFQAQAQSTVSDRYAYFPLIGAGLLFGSLFGRRMWSTVLCAALILTTLSVLTLQRSQVWATNEIFFRDMLDKNDKSHVALSSLGVEYILTNRYPEAEVVLNRAAMLKPMDVIPRTNLAQLYLLLNRPDKVVSDITPLLDDKEFLRINQTETRALASAYRLSARAHWGMDLWTKANDYYCRWFNLDFENEEGKAEVQRFLEDAKKHGSTLTNCEIKLAR